MGKKLPLTREQVKAIRALPQSTRNLALFNIAIDSKLSACNIVALRVADVVAEQEVKYRGIVTCCRSNLPVSFEISDETEEALFHWITQAHLIDDNDFLFPSRNGGKLTTRQYSRIVTDWITAIGLDPATYGTNSLRRTKAMLIYKETSNIAAVQKLLGHKKLSSTVHFLGLQSTDDPLAIDKSVKI